MTKLLVVAIAMLCPLTAFAAQYSYVIPDGWSSPMCRSIRDALSDGLVLDAQKPLCERRFELSPKARRLGLRAIRKTLLPASGYSSLLLEFVELGDHNPSTFQVEKDKKQVARVLESYINYIYISHFDADNSGKSRQVYIWYSPNCNLDADIPGTVYTYIRNDNGTLDPSWNGKGPNIDGVPFFYRGQTTYVSWSTMGGAPMNNKGTEKGVAELDVFGAGPLRPGQGVPGPYNTLSSSECKVFQVEKEN